MSQEHLKLISGYKIPQRTLGSILDILGLEKPWSRTTCSLGIHGYGHGNSFLILFQFSVQVNWSLLILPLPKKLPMVALTIFLIKVLIKTFSFFQQDSSELTGKKNTALVALLIFSVKSIQRWDFWLGHILWGPFY